MNLRTKFGNRSHKCFLRLLPATAGAVLSLLLTATQFQAGAFQNLNFEAAAFTPGPPYPQYLNPAAAVPGWTVFLGASPAYSVTYNAVALDSLNVSILDNNALYGVLPQAFQGHFTVALQGGFSVYPTQRDSASIAQTGLIPGTATSLLFDAKLNFPERTNFTVSIAGEIVPFYPLAYHTNYMIYGADVSRFAGQTLEVRFTAYPRLPPELAINTVYLDDIRFSTTPVPSEFVYVIQGGTITITGYTGPGGAVTIPGTISGLPVTAIGPGAFYQCSTLTSIAIPNSVTAIGSSAFASCANLASANIPPGVTSIAATTFADCLSLANVTIPLGVTSIGDSAFSSCRRFTSLTIPGSVVTVGNSAFRACQALTNVVIPNSVTSIGDEAFAYCGLVDVSIPSSITGLSSAVFRGCTQLTNVTIPNSVASIGSSTFYGCNRLPGISLPDGITSIGADAFAYCTSLTQLAFPKSLTSLGDLAFEWCTGLTNVTLPGSLTQIPEGAFYDCSRLATVAIPSGVISTGGSAFSGCRLTEVMIPRTATNIGDWAFAECAYLTKVTLPDGVRNLGSWTFSRCYSLTNITIPDAVATIGNYAFCYSTNLTSVYFTGNAPSLGGSGVFTGDTRTTIYYLPGTSGWGPTFGGRPTALWNPVIQTADPGFGVHTNHFGFSINGTPNIPITIEASPTVINPSWSLVLACNLTNGSAWFSDPDLANHPARFYRLRWP